MPVWLKLLVDTVLPLILKQITPEAIAKLETMAKQFTVDELRRLDKSVIDPEGKYTWDDQFIAAVAKALGVK
jgi:hypothetical protein